MAAQVVGESQEQAAERREQDWHGRVHAGGLRRRSNQGHTKKNNEKEEINKIQIYRHFVIKYTN